MLLVESSRRVPSGHRTGARTGPRDHPDRELATSPRTGAGKHPEDGSVRAVRDGDDVIASSQKRARRIARGAGDGADPIGPERSRGAGNRPHYHPAGGKGDHVFYSIAAGLTVSHYVSEDATGLIKTGAAVVDFFNPLAIFNDAIEIVEEIKGEPTENVEPEGQ